MECPRCRPELTTDPYRGADARLRPQAKLHAVMHAAGVEIDQCHGCGGVFLDHTELEKIQVSSRKSSTIEPPLRIQRVYQHAHVISIDGSGQEEKQPLVCPSCGGEMAERNFGFGTETLIDTCIECRGVWLDCGELEALEGAFG